MASKLSSPNLTSVDAGALASAQSVRQGERIEVANSSGIEAPATAAPIDGVDAHIHIFDPRWPRPKPQPSDIWATVADELAKRRRTGLSRCVIVHPSSYGSDNAALIDALGQLGDTARGVVTVPVDVSEKELDAFHAQGVRGIRLYLTGTDRQPSPELIRAHANRLAPRGWHIEFVVREAHLIAAEDVLADLPCRIVVDHFAHMQIPLGTRQPVGDTVKRLLDKGHTYMKLAAVYTVSKAPSPRFDDLTELAQTLISWAPERMLWGSDWPHTTAPTQPQVPDEALLFDELAKWAPSRALRQAILVENPNRLYWDR